VVVVQGGGLFTVVCAHGSAMRRWPREKWRPFAVAVQSGMVWWSMRSGEDP
jgi:hypothetical protein